MSNLREPQSSSPSPLFKLPFQSYEHGVNTFDTANIYSNGVSEVYLGRAIKTLNLPRGEIVVMTKVM
jgi:aryl-alcohol dehydrogenase-like predicted oxidoreductase